MTFLVFFYQSSIPSALSSEKRFTHAENVLDVHQPAIEAVKVADMDQFVSHWLIRIFICQEGLAGCGSIVPLCDESPWNENRKLFIFYSWGQLWLDCNRRILGELSWSWFCWPLLLTEYNDSIFMSSISPHSGGDCHEVVCKVVENINVLPVVESIGILCTCTLDEPWQNHKEQWDQGAGISR